MGGYILIGGLAAFGVLCAAWCLLGWRLTGSGGTLVVVLCGSGKEETVIQRHAWLRGLGLVRGRLVLVGSMLPDRERQCLQRKYRDVEFCSLEELPARLEVERVRLG